MLWLMSSNPVLRQAEAPTLAQADATLDDYVASFTKTDDANEFKLTTAKGATWEINSDAVKLGEHVGHTVTITGVVSNAAIHGAKEDAKDEAREHGVGENSTEHGHMTVTGLKMVSESCSQ